jgi:hypothetical protein
MERISILICVYLRESVSHLFSKGLNASPGSNPGQRRLSALPRWVSMGDFANPAGVIPARESGPRAAATNPSPAARRIIMNMALIPGAFRVAQNDNGEPENTK